MPPLSMSPLLKLPLVEAGQAQKHVTVNEALLRLDAVVQLVVVSATTTAQPGSPADGDVYLLPAGKTGAAWGAMANGAVASWRDGAWEAISPREGWLAYAQDGNLLLRWSGTAWAAMGAGEVLTVSAGDRVLGRASSGAGAAEEIACTAAGRALIAGADAAAQRSALGAVGTADASTFTARQTIDISGVAGPGLLIFTGSSIEYGWGVRRFAGDYVSFGLHSTDGHGEHFRLDVGNGSSVAAALTVYPDAVAPPADNASSLGYSDRRFSVVYAATGTINTSDAREKTPLAPIPAGVRRAVRRVLAGVGVFQWRASVDGKGADRARLHIGVTAQGVRDAFLAEGEDPERWALFCADPVTRDVARAGGEEGRPETFERVPVLDEAGAPVMRLGLRLDQLMILALADLGRVRGSAGRDQ